MGKMEPGIRLTGDAWRQEGIGQTIHDLASRLFPICRSITGKGVRDTIDILKDYIDIEQRAVPSGTRVFDWTVPQEWIVRDAYVKTRQDAR